MHLEQANLFSDRKACKCISRLLLIFSETVPTTKEFDLMYIRDIEQHGHTFRGGFCSNPKSFYSNHTFSAGTVGLVGGSRD